MPRNRRRPDRNFGLISLIFRPMNPITMAADVGGTRIKLGLVQDSKVLTRDVIDARSHEGLAPQLPRIVNALDQLCAGCGVARSGCAALGMAFPSIIDIRTGRVLTHYGKFTDAEHLDLPSWSQQAMGVPLAIDNDARTAMLGEWKAGAGKGCDNLVMITFGTGLGTSAVIEGRLLRGVHGQAGIQGGHLSVRHDGRRCACGNVGCAEAEASTSVLATLVRERADLGGSKLAALDSLDYAAVLRLAREDDPAAKKLREHTISVWSAMIVNLIHAYDPQRVIVGGGIVAGGDDFLPELTERVRSRAQTPWGTVEIARAQLGDDAALIGCEFLVRERLNR